MAKNVFLTLEILLILSMTYMLVAYFKQCTATATKNTNRRLLFTPEIRESWHRQPEKNFFLMGANVTSTSTSTTIRINDIDAPKLRAIYVAALDRLKPRQRGFVENFLHNPETAGDVKNSGKAAKYAQGGINELYELVPDAGHIPTMLDPESMHPVTLAILIGLRLKAETLKRIEEKKGEQRVKLGLTPDWVLKNLKEVAVRAMGYDFDPETLEKTGAFQKSSFQPAAAQRSLEALGREMGMFYDRGPGEKAKTLDEMDETELDEAIANYDRRILELTKMRDGGTGDE